jgi:hypothetical protein
MNPPENLCTPMGTHLVHIDGDSMLLIARGPLTERDMQQLLELYIRIKREHGLLFAIYDGRQCTGIESGARKMVSKFRVNAAEATLRVGFGLPFTVRVVLAMILRAQRALVNVDVAVHIFEHEHEAYAFFEAERARLRKKLKQ